MKFENIEAVIFDLGGVVLNLNYQATEKAFEGLGIENFSSLYSQAEQTGIFDEFETGKISVPYFINKLLDFLPSGTSANQVVNAWNAMILDFPIENLNFLKEIQKSKRIFLLSNTNEIHLQAVNRALDRACGEKNLNHFFESVYYSHELGLRKPDAVIFEHVLQKNKLNPHTTLFIDDTLKHIEGARKLEIVAELYPQNKLLSDFFNM